MRTRAFEAGSGRTWVPITQCAWCRGIRLGRWYLRLPLLPLLPWRWLLSIPPVLALEISTTYGVCPKCARRARRAAERRLLFHDKDERTSTEV